MITIYHTPISDDHSTIKSQIVLSIKYKKDILIDINLVE